MTTITDYERDYIRLPAAWKWSEAKDFMQLCAGRAYLLSQMDITSEPDHEFTRSGSGDTASYSVFDDGSLWYCNNAEDEVWSDYRDFVTERLLPGLEACSHAGQPSWGDDDNGDWVIDEMDRGLLVLFHDGDEDAAKDAVGCGEEASNE